MHETRRAFKTPSKDAANPLHTRLGNNQATVSVLKLMMIIQVYVRFLMLRRRLMRLIGQNIVCYLPPSLTLRITLAYLAYISMFCLTQERGRQNISMKRQQLVGSCRRWALSARSVDGSL